MRSVNKAGKEYIYAIFYDCVDRGKEFNEVYATYRETLKEAENRVVWQSAAPDMKRVWVAVKEWDSWITFDTVMEWTEQDGLRIL